MAVKCSDLNEVRANIDRIDSEIIRISVIKERSPSESFQVSRSKFWRVPICIVKAVDDIINDRNTKGTTRLAA